MSHRKLKEVLAGMTFRQKVDHIWTYYKWLLAPIALAVLLIWFVANIVINNRTEILYSGALVNVTVSDEGIDYLSDDWFETLQGEEGKQRVDLMFATFDVNNTISLQLDAGSYTKVTAAVTARELDYVITEYTGFEYCVGSSAFAPLTDVLPAQTLAGLEEQLIYLEDESGTYPVALDITQTAFARECISGTECVYLAFPGNTGRNARNDAFLTYLLGWED